MFNQIFRDGLSIQDIPHNISIRYKNGDFNNLVGNLNNIRKRLSKETKLLKEKVSTTVDGSTPETKPKMQVDLRKMAIVSQIQDHVIACRKYIINLFKDHLKHVMVRKIPLDADEGSGSE